MLLKSLLTTALLLGSTSAALARPVTSTAAAGVRIDAQLSFGPRVRDHRVNAAPHSDGYVRDDRYSNTVGEIYGRDGRNLEYYPLDTRDRSTIECRNWDPLVDIGNERCAPIGMRQIAAPYELPGWATLGARDSSVPGGQFITVEQSFHRLQIRAIDGAPSMTKMQVRYMDGSADIIAVDRRMLRHGFVLPVRAKAIDQVIFYTTDGSRGVYLVSAS